MFFLSAVGRSIYGASTILAFLTGLMAFLVLIAAALFAGFGPFALVFWTLFTAWAIFSLLPLAHIASRSSYPTWCTTLAASVVLLLCVSWLNSSLKGKQIADPLYFSFPTSACIWLGIPIVFNAIQAILSLFRLQQIRSLR